MQDNKVEEQGGLNVWVGTTFEKILKVFLDTKTNENWDFAKYLTDLAKCLMKQDRTQTP